jgi:Cys-rich repeat protein
VDSDSADSGSSGDTTPGTDTGAATTTGVNPLPDGSMCTADDQCESEQCFQVPVLGGICGECNEDADCADGGCSIPNPLTMAPSVCNDGGLGGGCESDDVCQDGLTCALILSVDAIGLQAATCSECAEDGDCGNGQLCTPTYDVANISGHKFCVDSGMVANGEGCDFEGTGNDACTSGLCTPASAKGFVDLGICSECGTDGMGMTVDCPGMGTCTEAMVSLSEGLIPGTCM